MLSRLGVLWSHVNRLEFGIQAVLMKYGEDGFVNGLADAFVEGFDADALVWCGEDLGEQGL